MTNTWTIKNHSIKGQYIKSPFIFDIKKTDSNNCFYCNNHIDHNKSRYCPFCYALTFNHPPESYNFFPAFFYLTASVICILFSVFPKFYIADDCDRGGISCDANDCVNSYENFIAESDCDCKSLLRYFIDLIKKITQLKNLSCLKGKTIELYSAWDPDYIVTEESFVLYLPLYERFKIRNFQNKKWNNLFRKSVFVSYKFLTEQLYDDLIFLDYTLYSKDSDGVIFYFHH